MCMDVCVDVCLYACMDVCLYVCMDVCLDVCMDVSNHRLRILHARLFGNQRRSREGVMTVVGVNVSEGRDKAVVVFRCRYDSIEAARVAGHEPFPA